MIARCLDLIQCAAASEKQQQTSAFMSREMLHRRGPETETRTLTIRTEINTHRERWND